MSNTTVTPSGRPAPNGTAATGGAGTGPTTARQRWSFLAIISLGLFLVGADNSILYTALPVLRDELQTTSLQGLWIINAYPLVLVGLLLGTGTLGDKIGHRRMFLTGVSVFGLGSLLAAFSPDAWVLIAARAVLGVGAATMMPATLALIRQTFTDVRERNTAIGIWGSVAVVGAASGPVLGGFLLEHFYWGTVFLINVPVVVAILIATVIYAPANQADPSRHWDVISSLWAMIMMVGAVMAIKETANSEGDTTIVLVSVAAMVVGGALFAHRQTLLRGRGLPPLLEFGIFRNRMFLGGTLAAALAMFVLSGVELMTTQRFQSAGGFSPFEAGLLVASAAIPAAPASILGGASLHRLGFRTLISGGFTSMAAGIAVVLWAVPEQPLGLVVCGLVLIGVGAGMVMSVSSSAIIGSAPASKAGMASSVEAISYEFGTLVSVALLGSLMPMFYSMNAPDAVADDVDHGVDHAVFGAAAVDAYDTAYLLVILIAGIVAVAAALITARSFRGNPKEAEYSAHE
ncbi:MAG TPA: MFS transporter [Candidatus Corynebacterium avicola]|uniref:MFS transporter n=1 Tax=Candidatus Corynebacterium avicola TaxID=2838527 RepID=A0A9D1RPF4_9CORY|nr:MFS transporter [Candidatus Corynebacterium avicola]